MSIHQKFREVFKFSQLPGDWQVTWAAADWNGAPLLVAVDGKPRFPAGDAPAVREWYGIPAKAHHLIYWDGAAKQTVTFEDSGGLLSPKAIQPLGAGWLLDSSRGFRVYDRNGRVQRTLELGDGINDVQTTQNDHIWVGYLDEGVFGDGISTQGVVAFDASGAPIFKYHEFIEGA